MRRTGSMLNARHIGRAQARQYKPSFTRRADGMTDKVTPYTATAVGIAKVRPYLLRR